MQSELQTELNEIGLDPFDRGWFTHCRTIANELHCYAPQPFHEMPAELRTYYGRLEELLTAVHSSEQIASSFGSWRAYVTENEARNARKLEVVLDAARRLREMRERIPRLPNAGAMAELAAQCERFAISVYRAEPPSDAVLRLWCMRRTRRFDLLPGEWRYV